MSLPSLLLFPLLHSLNGVKFPRPPYIKVAFIRHGFCTSHGKAHEAQAVVRRLTDVPCSWEEDPSGVKKVYGGINVFRTLERAAEIILRE